MSLCNCQLTSAVVPIVAPSSTVVTPTRLYPLYYTLHLSTLTLTCQQLHALVALSSAFVSHIFIQLLRCTLHWLQLNKWFSLLISLRNHQTFFHTHSFCWKLAVTTTALHFWTHTRPYFPILFCTVFDPGLTSSPAHIFFLYQIALTLLIAFICCVSHSNLQFYLLF